jgi:hypothetical protein
MSRRTLGFMLALTLLSSLIATTSLAQIDPIKQQPIPISPTKQLIAPTPDHPEIDNIVIATSIDEDACPLDIVTFLESSDLPFYAVTPHSSVPAATRVFARLLRHKVLLKDTEVLTAQQAFKDICIMFEFDPRNAALPPDDYQIQFFVNGMIVDTAFFEVR